MHNTEYPSLFMFSFLRSFESYFPTDAPKLTTIVTNSKTGIELEIIAEEKSDNKLTGTKTKVQIVFNALYPPSIAGFLLASVNDKPVFGTSKGIGYTTAQIFHQDYLNALV